MEFLTREIIDLLIYAVIAAGLVLASIRLYRDFTRPLPQEDGQVLDDDTQPNKPVSGQPEVR